MPRGAVWYFLTLSLLLLTLSAAGAQQDSSKDSGFYYYGSWHENVDQSHVIKAAKALKSKKHKRRKHPLCDVDTGKCKW